MKSKRFLLPKMAVNNIAKNTSTYMPYMGVSIFAVFTYFIFDLIINNEIMHTLPKAAYAYSLIAIGFLLFGIIMVPFLYYTNSFLIKRRKKELGLYSILGLEKKHIGIMMFWESLISYCVVEVVAIIAGMLFFRLIFLLLLNMVKLFVDVQFSVSIKAITDTLIFYAFVTGLNLLVNLIQVGKARPVELMSGSKKGEKEPKFIWLWTILGLVLLGIGYKTALCAELNSMIFSNFFLAIFLVVGGTYFLFTSGSIALLRGLKKRKRFYYKTENFVTVSGMLYRMKKNAASLSNICIFATMVVITVICTVSVWISMDSIIDSMNPREMQVCFQNTSDEELLQEEFERCAKEQGVVLQEYVGQQYVPVGTVYKNGTILRRATQIEMAQYGNVYELVLMTADAFNRMEGKNESLKQGEIIIFTTGTDIEVDEIVVGDMTLGVKERVSRCKTLRKENKSSTVEEFVLVCADYAEIQKVCAQLGGDSSNVMFMMGVDLEGDAQTINGFIAELTTRFQDREDFAGIMDYRERIAAQEGMYGGLLFIGIIFGAIFLICFLVIMYYKQIAEGFEDQKSFEIMQKVGMSDAEIRGTIRQQIRLVFVLPLAGALLHTVIGMKMVVILMKAISCYEQDIIMLCTLAVCLGFTVVYGICYRRTSSVYYRIVKRMN